MENVADIKVINGVETYNGVEIFKGTDISEGIQTRSWGRPIVNSKVYTISELESMYGNKYYWVVNDTAINFLKAVSVFLLGGAGVALSGFLSFMNGAYKAKVAQHLSTIKAGGAKGIYVKQVWDCGPIYGYYERGATEVSIVYSI